MLYGTETGANLLKWPGSKSRLLGYLKPRLQKALSLSPASVYYEPFLGSANVYRAVRPRSGVISDVVPDIINFYRMISYFPQQVWDYLCILRTFPIETKRFLQVREEYNEATKEQQTDPKVFYDPRQAARFIYINRCGFNGLWRVNKSGYCSTSPGEPNEARFPSRVVIAAAARSFARATLLTADFSEMIPKAQAGDVIYADPPYAGEGFTGYSAEGFGEERQRELATMLKEAHERGVYVLASNLDLPIVHCLYEWARRKPITLEHAIGGHGVARKQVQELLIESRAVL